MSDSLSPEETLSFNNLEEEKGASERGGRKEAGALTLVMDGVEVARAGGTLEVVHAMASLRGAGLDRQSVAILIALCEHRANPEALTAVVKELRREAAALDTANKKSEAL